MTQPKPARALWITGPEKAVLRDTHISATPDTVSVRTLFTGVSRGTESLVFRGQVPLSEHDTMRAPFQEGDFSFPVKYGYAAVGQIETGAQTGAVVFGLFPHQSQFSAPETALCPVPKAVPSNRAVLAANMETALNITWDAQISIGDRVVVVGCGVVGALVGYLAARIAGTDVTLIDIDPARERVAQALGCGFALSESAPQDADVVVHASASAAGLATAISVAGIEARIVEASWYGARHVEAPLGGRFHQRRLQLISSQVGRIPAHQAARWTYHRRMSKALSLLDDSCLDVLISGETSFAALAEDYGDILSSPATLCHRVRYDHP